MTLGWPCAARHERRLDDGDHGARRDRRRPVAVARRRCTRGRSLTLPPDELRRRASGVPGAEPRRGGAARTRRAAGRRDRDGRAGRPVVRARPLRPAAADPDPRRAARPPRARRADLRRLLPRPPGLRRPRRARARRAREPVAGAHARSPPSTCTSPAPAWDVVRGDDPRALARAAATPDERLPYLAPALRRLLEELPGTRDGLGAHRAPAARGGGRRRAHARATRSSASMAAEEAPFMGDTIAFDRLDELDAARQRQRQPAAHRGRPGRAGGPTPIASRCSASTAGSAACTSAPRARCGAGTTSEASSADPDALASKACPAPPRSAPRSRMRSPSARSASSCGTAPSCPQPRRRTGRPSPPARRRRSRTSCAPPASSASAAPT